MVHPIVAIAQTNIKENRVFGVSYIKTITTI